MSLKLTQSQRRKGEAQNTKEATMRLKTLCKVIQRENPKRTYADDWLWRTHGLQVQQGKTPIADGYRVHPVVVRTYDVDVCPWPRVYGIPYNGQQTVHHDTSVPLADYWRLALAGQGI